MDNKNNISDLIEIHESILVDTIFSNMSYLEPRKFLLLNKAINDRLYEYISDIYFENKNLDTDSFIKKVTDKIFFSDDVQKLKGLSIDIYEDMYEKSNILSKYSTTQIINLAVKDLENKINQLTISALLSTEYFNEEEKNNLENKIKNIPKTLIDKVIGSDEDKKISYDLMVQIYSQFKPVDFNENKSSFINKYNKEIEVTYDNGWFDFGETDKEYPTKDCSFLVGYIENESPKKLYISFRGTEKNATVLTDYFINDYPNMERHYNKMAPILEKVIKQEIENNNGDLQISFTGHSLGAAMAEIAMSKYKDTEKVKYTATLIANPGGIHIKQDRINELDLEASEIKNKIKKIRNSKQTDFDKSCEITALTVKKLLNFTKRSSLLISVGGTGAFLNLGKAMLKSRDDERLGVLTKKAYDFFELITKNKLMKLSGLDGYIDGSKYLARNISELVEPMGLAYIEEKRKSLLGKAIEDSRITSIRHEQDPIPKVGNSNTNHKKNNRIIIKATSKIKEKLNEFIKLKNTVYHSMDGYISEVYRGNLMAEENMKITTDKIHKIRFAGLNSVENNLKPSI